MNVQSIILLVFILALVAFVVWKQLYGKSRHSCCDQCDSQCCQLKSHSERKDCCH